MPVKKLLSLRHWKRVGERVLRILMSPQVPLRYKLLFIVPVLLYWILPDAMPFMPVDDIAVTMIVANFFAEWMERKHLP
ncbi:hypothetical protein [Paenibacillus hamazuiensis]|uniref:hypothetical protein n=1 Tax=Paenibacillus hamazuiensis TaxID=2936508 RepID=UPI00200EB225|nr:hypothetical protein [Paenibacillus hamazuiensis]